jgi:hypothetical protein
MSEVDRLSNSGLYPALPIADKRSRRDGEADASPGEKKPPGQVTPPSPDSPDSASPRPPKFLIDEYA